MLKILLLLLMLVCIEMRMALCGDVDLIPYFLLLVDHTGACGVGPMTIAMLMIIGEACLQK